MGWMSDWLSLSLLVCLMYQGQATKEGAPESACKSMMPGHHRNDGRQIAPQSTPPPFEIIVSEDTYSIGRTPSVTIRATGDLKFRGFMLQARRLEGNTEEPIGYFAPNSDKGTKVICRGSYGNVLTHIGGSPGSDQEKSELTVVWTVTRPTQGHVRFWATIVVNEYIFWVGEKSRPVRDILAGTLPTTTMRAPTKPTLLGLLETVTCGQGKGCYRNPPGCAPESCEMLVTWKEQYDSVEFELTGNSDGWVAMGLSDDTWMGNDDVTECVWNEGLKDAIVRQSYNRNSKENGVLDNPNLGRGGSVGQLTSGRIQCKFRLMKNRHLQSKLFDLSKPYHILLAKGDATEDGEKFRHSLEPGKYPYISPYKVSLKKKDDVTHTAKYPWVKLHGCLMLIAWMMCASTAVLMAKYYKPMWPNDKLCGERVWFAVHRGCLIATLVCTCLGFIFIFVHRRAYSTMPDLPDKAHPPLGITVTILCILNPLIALCRPRPKSKWRPVFNWIHWFFGLVAIVLATPTLFIGLNLHKAFVPWWATWVLVAFMLFHLIIELMLEIHGCLNSRKQESRTEEFELRKKSDPRGEYYGLEPEPVGTRFKKIILTLYLIVVIILGLIMVIAVAAG